MEEQSSNIKNTGVVRELSKEALLSLYPDVQQKEKNLIVIKESAASTIKNHVHWGEKTKENINEQCGILIGKPYIVNEKYISIVDYAIPGEPTYSNLAYVMMGHETWRKLLDIYDDEYREKGYYIVGWYHTHPNSLPVFMSGTDKNTQKLFFRQDWHFAVVLNPHRQLIAYFNAVHAEDCDGVCSILTEGDLS